MICKPQWLPWCENTIGKRLDSVRALPATIYIYNSRQMTPVKDSYCWRWRIWKHLWKKSSVYREINVGNWEEFWSNNHGTWEFKHTVSTLICTEKLFEAAQSLLTYVSAELMVCACWERSSNFTIIWFSSGRLQRAANQNTNSKRMLPFLTRH